MCLCIYILYIKALIHAKYMKCKHTLDTMSSLPIYWLLEIQNPHDKAHNLLVHKGRNELRKSH